MPLIAVLALTMATTTLLLGSAAAGSAVFEDAEVKRIGPQYYRVDMSVVRNLGSVCMGETTATGMLKGTTLTVLSETNRCKLQITFSRNVMQVREDHTPFCNDHGISCNFDGKFKRGSTFNPPFEAKRPEPKI
jgi:hypothetical protein